MTGKRTLDPCSPETHGARGNRVWDQDFASWRCRTCGHRTTTGERAPKQTRYMWPWRWPRELARRQWARTVDLPQRRSTDGPPPS